MMDFRRVKTQLISILSAAANNRFYVVGAQRQTVGAEEQLRRPRVVISSGSVDFKSDNSSYHDEKEAEPNYQIKITIARPVFADLALINNPESTAEQRATAIMAAQNGCDEVNNALNEAADNVYQIIEDARNYDMGLKVGTVRDRKINRIEIFEAQQDGQLITAAAILDFSCKVTESVTGEEGVPAADGFIDGTTHPQNENTVNAGVIA